MDTKEYIKYFLDEAYDYYSQITENLINLENDYNNIEFQKIIFRAAHNLKGNSAAIGFMNINQIVHKFETLFQEIIDKKRNLTEEIMDFLFKAIDTVMEQLEHVQENGNDESENTDKILEEFKKILGSKEKKKVIKKTNDIYLSKEQNSLAIKEKEQNSNIYIIDIKFDDECQFKIAEAALILKLLEDVSKIIYSNPDFNMLHNITKLDNCQAIISTLKSKKDIREIIFERDVSSIKIDDYKIKQSVFEEIKPKKEISNKKNDRVSDFIKVNSEKIDEQIALIGELMTSKSAVTIICSEFEHLYRQMKQVMNLKGEGVCDEMYEPFSALSKNIQKLKSTGESLERVVLDMQNNVMNVRLVPVSVVFSRLPKLVRDLSKELNKKINYKIIGEDTEIDKTIIDNLIDPLIHLIRNAIDHGIESEEIRAANNKSEIGNLKIEALHESDNVVIKIMDDGKGLKREIIEKKAIEKGIVSSEEAKNLSNKDIYNLIFHHGFSTSENISNISGRGVGMDVVKDKISIFNGKIDVETVEGESTTFILRFPLTLAIIQALIVETMKRSYSIPIKNIHKTVIIEDIKSLNTIDGTMVYNYLDTIIPVYNLDSILEEDDNVSNNLRYLVIIYSNGKHMGLLVKKLISKEDTVIKSIDDISENSKKKYISGATISGDGNVNLILDVYSLIHNYHKNLN